MTFSYKTIKESFVNSIHNLIHNLTCQDHMKGNNRLILLNEHFQRDIHFFH